MFCGIDPDLHPEVLQCTVPVLYVSSHLFVRTFLPMYFKEKGIKIGISLRLHSLGKVLLT